ncbi:MAG: ABC transporter permease [Chryseolinea sp.]
MAPTDGMNGGWGIANTLNAVLSCVCLAPFYYQVPNRSVTISKFGGIHRIMLRNYFLSVWRYIARNRFFTAINILGLVIGMTAFMLITQFVVHEFSYDKFWVNSNRIYRVQLDRYDRGELSTRWASGANGLGPDLKDNFPEVEAYTRLASSNSLLSYGDTFFKEDHIYYASQDFFKVFGIRLLEGTDSTALKGLNKIVLSKSLAKKYFRDESPVGKTMRNNGTTEYLVTGVFDDIPANSHMSIDALLSFATYAKRTGRDNEDAMREWQWDGFFTYLLIDKNAKAHELEAKFNKYVLKHLADKYKDRSASMVLNLQFISDIHLDSDFIGEFKENGNRDTTYFLMVVAALTIVIAWINYVNLSTAKSIERAREVGVRKVMGSFRIQLVQQFLSESLLLNISCRYAFRRGRGLANPVVQQSYRPPPELHPVSRAIILDFNTVPYSCRRALVGIVSCLCAVVIQAC